MTDDRPDTAADFLHRESARRWLKSSLEAWLDTNYASSFRPFHYLYRARMEPEDILYSVYSHLESQPNTNGQSSTISVFRVALGELVAEPEIVERKPILFGILLRLGAKIGCLEIIDALGVLSRQKKLQMVDARDILSDQIRTFDLMEMSAALVIEGKFASRHTCKLCLNLIRSSGPNYAFLPELFERILEIEPNKAIEHAADLADEIQDFLLSRMDYGDIEFSLAEHQLKKAFSTHVPGQLLSSTRSSQAERLAKSSAGFLVSDLITHGEAPRASPPFKPLPKGKQPLASAIKAQMERRKREVTPRMIESKLEKYAQGTRTPLEAALERDDAEEAVLHDR